MYIFFVYFVYIFVYSIQEIEYTKLVSTKNIHALLGCTYIWDTVQEKAVWHKMAKIGSFLLFLLYTHTGVNLLKQSNKISITVKSRLQRKTPSEGEKVYLEHETEEIIFCLAIEFCTLPGEDFLMRCFVKRF